ncbi:MAG: hypothetical protein HY812_12220 [Planctomycetes bacterium]|nr:hypothetical protein [Planctomycetota bacterium]
MRTLITALACCAVAAPAASAAVRKVPQQYPSITAAVAAAGNGDVIKIDKGRYQEAVVTTKRLTFQGVKGTIWDGYYSSSHHAQLAATANDVAVKGIEFQNGSSPVTITGDDALVTACTFRASSRGAAVDGARAKVSKNLFSGLRSSTGTVQIQGPDAIVDGNDVLDGHAAWIDIDAEGGGSATVTNNVMDTNHYYARIGVSNATAPVVKKNKVLNTYAEDNVIDVDNCDDAVVSGNTLSNINYSVYAGIYVAGERPTVAKNAIELLNCYSDDIRCIWVEGGEARVSGNKVRACGAGTDNDTWGIYVAGTAAVVEKNLVEDLGGGGSQTYGIDVMGDDATAAKNTVRNLNDEYALGIRLDGDRARAQKNKISNVMYWPLLEVTGDNFRIEDNAIKGGAYSSNGIDVTGSATAAGAAVIRHNKISNIVDTALRLTGDAVIVQGNVLKHVADNGVLVSGSDNALRDNKVSNTCGDGFAILGGSNSLSECTVVKADRDGFDINGNLNSLDKCKATDCAAEGLDNGGGTNTTATHCTLKGSRIDYAGNGGVVNDAGTTYQTGGPGTPPEID